jgi:ABC-type multidrug transport system ATPase subunit
MPRSKKFGNKSQDDGSDREMENDMAQEELQIPTTSARVVEGAPTSPSPNTGSKKTTCDSAVPAKHETKLLKSVSAQSGGSAGNAASKAKRAVSPSTKRHLSTLIDEAMSRKAPASAGGAAAGSSSAIRAQSADPTMTGERSSSAARPGRQRVAVSASRTKRNKSSRKMGKWAPNPDEDVWSHPLRAIGNKRASDESDLGEQADSEYVDEDEVPKKHSLGKRVAKGIYRRVFGSKKESGTEEQSESERAQQAQMELDSVVAADANLSGAKQVPLLDGEYETPLSALAERKSKPKTSVSHGTSRAMENPELPFLEWQNLSFSANPGSSDEKKILKNCYGRLYPGELCALIGPSGAGKSTMMNLLAGRQGWGDNTYRCSTTGEVKTEKVGSATVRMTGDISYGGVKCTFQELKDSIGYVMQEDAMIATETVEETLTFAAKLRLPKMPEKKLKKKVATLLKDLGLEGCKDVYIGDKLLKGISGGQKKRVSAGIELISSPDILFLDEPTSGLDSFSSLALIKALKKIARNQNAIICATIHQPSAELFNMFDRVMCLRSGCVVFSGALHGQIVPDLKEVLALDNGESTSKEDADFRNDFNRRLAIVAEEGSSSSLSGIPEESQSELGSHISLGGENDAKTEYCPDHPDRQKSIDLMATPPRSSTRLASGTPSTTAGTPNDKKTALEDIELSRSASNLALGADAETTQITAMEEDDILSDAHSLCSIPNILHHVAHPQPAMKYGDDAIFEENASFSTNMCDWLLYLAQTMEGRELDLVAELTRIFYEYDAAKLASLQLQLAQSRALLNGPDSSGIRTNPFTDCGFDTDGAAATPSTADENGSLSCRTSIMDGASVLSGGSGSSGGSASTHHSYLRNTLKKARNSLRLYFSSRDGDQPALADAPAEPAERDSDKLQLGSAVVNGGSDGFPTAVDSEDDEGKKSVIPEIGTAEVKSNAQTLMYDHNPAFLKKNQFDELDDGLNGDYKCCALFRPRDDGKKQKSKLVPFNEQDFWTQTWLLTVRETQQLSRKKMSLFVRIFIPVIQVACFGMVYWNAAGDVLRGADRITAGRGGWTTAGEWSLKMNLVKGALGHILFLLMITVATQNVMNIPAERPVFLREYSSKMYSIKPYMLSKLIVETPLLLLHSLLLMTLTYFMFGCVGNFFLMWLIAFQVTMCGSSWGVFLSCLAADPHRGLILCPLFLDSFPECFSGVLQRLKDVMIYFRWLAWFTPHSYAAEITAELEYNWVDEMRYLATNNGASEDLPNWEAAYKACRERFADRCDLNYDGPDGGSVGFAINTHRDLHFGDAFSSTFQTMWLNKEIPFLRSSEHLDDPIEMNILMPKFLWYSICLLTMFVVLRLVAMKNLERFSQSLF